MSIRIPQRSIPLRIQTRAHAGVDMSEGWFSRLKSGGVALAFAIGLLTAGLLRLPYSTQAQQQQQQQGPYGAGIQPASRIVPPAAASLQSLSEAFASIAEH